MKCQEATAIAPRLNQVTTNNKEHEIMTKTNFEANQEFTRRYAQMTGKISLLEVVEVFAKTHIPLAILSSMVTTFTFYHLFMPIFKNPLPSLALALLLAALIEILKTYAWIWAFAKQVLLTRYMAYSVSIGLVTISILFHVLGAERGTKGELSQAVEREANYQREEKNINSQIILELLKNNNGLNAVLLNGTSEDDGKATSAIVENTKFAQMLTSKATGGITGKELLLIKADSVESNQRAIMWLLITAEFLMLFSLLSKLIIRLNVDKNQAEFVDLKEALQIELYNAHTANMQGMIDLAKDEISKVQEQNRNALPSSNNQTEKKPILEEYKKGVDTENTNDASIPCTENIDQENEPKRDDTLVLDLMKYNYLDSQIILALFDNGTKGKGDKLVKKSLVLAELEEQGVKEDDYVTLLRRLKKQELVTFDVGYYSNCSLENIVKNVS